MKNPSSFKHEMIIPLTYAGQRLDQALAALLPAYSRNRLQQWIKHSQVWVNGKVWRSRDKLQGGEQLLINASFEEALIWPAQPLDLSIIAEDEAVLVMNKPAGLVVHPGAGNIDHTLANALLHYLPSLQQVPRAGIVHRLDKDTTGLLVVAKTVAAHTALIAQLQARQVHREYYAVVNGVMIAGGTITQPVGRHPTQRQKMAVVLQGKPAITHYRVVERFRAHTLIKVLLETGRTHQIRVHMAHRGYPVTGDVLYGARPILPKGANPSLVEAIQQFKRQALHALRLTFMHPLTGEKVTYASPLAADLHYLIDRLREDGEKPYDICGHRELY